MTSSLLNIGKSGLFAAQVGLSTTGHNISNANVAGYTRQSVVQNATLPQNSGFGFTGTGTEVTTVKRIYDSFLTSQVRSAQTTSASLETFSRQISQIDNLLADPAAGLSPALQDFFKGVQDLSSNPASSASRQALLSGADSLASRFHMLSARLTEIGDGVNTEIVSNVEMINSYARQIAQLNGSISNLSSANQPPNDMLDQRDQLITELNKYIKTTVVQDGDGRATVSIGAGQPLVVGTQTFQLAATGSPTDPSRMQVGYQVGSKVAVLPENSLNGGSLGGLLEFRSSTLDQVQNSLGRVALSLALSFNAQHKLGQDLSGDMGTDFFNVEPASVSASSRNNATSTTVVSAVATDPGQLTGSDYSMNFTGGSFFVKRLPDGVPEELTGSPQTVDGVEYTYSGAAAEGDSFLVRPTVFGAANFNVLITDRSKIAAGAPVRPGALSPSNTGSAKISTVSVDAAYLPPSDPASTVALPLTLAFDAASGMLTGFPLTAQVSVNGVAVGSPGDDVSYNAGDVLTFGGISVTFSGIPRDLDTFTIEANLEGVGDNRNAVLLGKLQTANILDDGHTTYQGSYAGMVSFVGNKTRETQIDSQASASLVAQSEAAQQAVSGVNLDEEAANLLRYQQAYQASGKVMQIASDLFDVLLSLGR
jgi:flagellar hook-associated protein 1 FlgK